MHYAPGLKPIGDSKLEYTFINEIEDVLNQERKGMMIIGEFLRRRLSERTNCKKNVAGRFLQMMVTITYFKKSFFSQNYTHGSSVKSQSSDILSKT